MAGDAPKKHHYLPVFYLNAFCDPAVGARNKREVWVYSQGHRPRRSTPANEGYQKHANTFILPSGARDMSVETGLAREIDGPAAPIIQKLDANPGVTVSPQELDQLALFAGFLFSRTPTGRYVSEKVTGPVADALLLAAAQTPAKFAAVLAQELGNTPSNVEELRQQVLIGQLGDPKEMDLLSMIDLGQRYAQHLKERNWIFNYSEGDYEFVTCDNPFITAV
jgi:hypothetical protein